MPLPRTASSQATWEKRIRISKALTSTSYDPVQGHRTFKAQCESVTSWGPVAKKKKKKKKKNNLACNQFHSTVRVVPCVVPGVPGDEDADPNTGPDCLRSFAQTARALSTACRPTVRRRPGASSFRKCYRHNTSVSRSQSQHQYAGRWSATLQPFTMISRPGQDSSCPTPRGIEDTTDWKMPQDCTLSQDGTHHNV